MRTLIFCPVLVLSLIALAGGPPVEMVHPEAGEEVPPQSVPPGIHLLVPAAGAPSVVRLLDARGEPVACRVEHPTMTERTLVPDRPLGPGQYTVELPELGVVKSFTVGPDIYPPRLLSAGPAKVTRDSSLELIFTEGIDATRVNPETVEVREFGNSSVRTVPGKYRVDREGTRLTFTPVWWPGFTPGGSFELRIRAGELGDRAGNDMEEIRLAFAGAPEPTGDGPPAVPHAVYWSSRTELGILDLSLGSHGPFPARTTRVGDPKEIAVDPRVLVNGDGVAYGLNPRRHEVLVLNGRSGEILQRVPLRSPAGLAVDPKARWLFVTSKKEGTLIRFDATLAFKSYGNGLPRDGEVQVGRKPAGVAVSPDGRFVACVTARDRTVSVFQTEDLALVARFATGPKPEDLAFLEKGDGGHLLLVTCRGRGRRGGAVMAFDPAGCGPAGEIDGLARPRRIAARGDTAWVALEGEDRIARVTAGPAGIALAARIPAGPRPVDVTLAPARDDLLFVVNRRAGRISVVSETEGGVTATVETPGAIAVASLGER